MTPKPRRPIAGSRTPSAVPKKIAGRGRTVPAPADPDEQVEQVEPVEQAAPVPPEDPGPETAPPSGLLTGRRTTAVLAALVGLLVLVVAGEIFYLAKDPLEPTDDRPVAVSELDTRLAVDDATRQLTEILEFTWRDYDEQTEDALSRIQDGKFKEEYEQTAEDTRVKVLEQKAEYSVEVLGSGVIEAGPDEVTTLVFLNQIVFRGQGKNRVGPEVYPFRIEVTTVRDGDRWLVSKITPR
jgi:hypothetical protein